MIRDVHHTLLLIGDFDRYVAFYGDVLGFELISRDEDRHGEFLDRILGSPGVVIKFALVIGEGKIIELIEPVVLV